VFRAAEIAVLGRTEFFVRFRAAGLPRHWGCSEAPKVASLSVKCFGYMGQYCCKLERHKRPICPVVTFQSYMLCMHSCSRVRNNKMRNMYIGLRPPWPQSQVVNLTGSALATWGDALKG